MTFCFFLQIKAQLYATNSQFDVIQGWYILSNHSRKECTTQIGKESEYDSPGHYKTLKRTIFLTHDLQSRQIETYWCDTSVEIVNK